MKKVIRIPGGVGLSHEFWEEVVDTMCYLVNKFPLSTLVNKNPYEVWDGTKPSLENLRVFGCDAFVHVPKKKRGKLDSKSKKCIFIGYKYRLKGYKLWILVSRKTIYNQDVIFKEVGETSRSEDELREEETHKWDFELRNDESDSQE